MLILPLHKPLSRENFPLVTLLLVLLKAVPSIKRRGLTLRCRCSRYPAAAAFADDNGSCNTIVWSRSGPVDTIRSGQSPNLAAQRRRAAPKAPTDGAQARSLITLDLRHRALL